MATLDQLAEAIKRADAAGNADDVRTLGQAYRALQAQQSPTGKPAIDPNAQMAYFKEHGVPGYGMQAFADRAIEGVPFIGGWLHDQAQNLRGAASDALRSLGLNTPTSADMNAGMDMAVKGSPIEAAAGSVFGQTAPLALAGGTIPLVGKLLGMTGGPVSRYAMSSLSTGGLMFGDKLARGGSLEDAKDVGLTGLLLGPATQGAGDLIALGARSLAPSATKTIANLSRAMKDDQIAPADIPAKLQQLGPEAMVMDLGPNLQAQAGALAAAPGQGQKILRDALSARGANAGERVASDVAQTIGAGPDVEELASKVIAAQKKAAGPLYDAVRDQPLPLGGNFTFVLKTPMGAQAFREAGKLMANDGIRPNGLTVGMVDYAKRALDDIAGAAKLAGEGNKARQATSLGNVLKAEADKWVPQYADARAAFAGPAKVLDAIKLGNGVWTKEMSPYQLQQALKAMSPSEQDAFLQGARGAIEAHMGNAVNDALALRNMFKKGWNEAKLRMVLGNDIAKDLLKRIDREAIFGKTANTVSGNSETARRAAAMGELGPGGSVHFEGKAGLLTRAFDAARNALHGYRQAKVSGAMAKVLASNAGNIDPQVLQQIAGRALAGPRRAAIAPASIPLGLIGLGQSALQS